MVHEDDRNIAIRNRVRRECVFRYELSSSASCTVSRITYRLANTKPFRWELQNYTFSYPQYFYYFVALHISEHIDDPGAEFLLTEVDEMIDKISSVEEPVNCHAPNLFR